MWFVSTSPLYLGGTLIDDHEMGGREWWLQVVPADHWYHPAPPYVMGITQKDGYVSRSGPIVELRPAIAALIKLVQWAPELNDVPAYVADTFGNLIAYGRRRHSATDWVMINDVELMLPEVVGDPLLLVTIQISSQGDLADIHAKDEARSLHPHHRRNET